jgi:hypothetical protein
MRLEPITLFWEKVDISNGPYACWPWTYSTFPLGYGRFNTDGKVHSAHRWLLGYLRGRPLAWSSTQRELACHRCDNPPCCNPTHLYIGSIADNIRDREARGRSRSGKVNAAKTNCPRGHEYDDGNTIVKRGMRNCRTCHRDWARARRAQKREG